MRSGPLATVVLFHDAPPAHGGPHHDWLIEDPTAAADGPLWAARVVRRPEEWLGGWDLHVLPPHRRHYLSFEGPVSGGRGSVRRVDAGQVTPLEWSEGRKVLDVNLAGFRGRVELTPVDGGLWRATLVG